MIARLATKIGVKALELALPKKLVIPVKAAIRPVELLRDLKRGRGR